MKVLKRTKHSITVLGLILFASSNLFAQSKIGIKLPPYKTPSFDFIKTSNFSLDNTTLKVDESIFIDTYSEPIPFNSPILNEVLTTFAIVNQFNQSAMPFFCKMEFQMEQAARFPVKIRLGDVNFVDRLESKKDWELGN